MKILFVGNLNPALRSFQRMRALDEIGHDVKALSYVRSDRQLGQKGSLLERLFRKVGFPLDPTRTNEAILREVSERRFDIVWIEKGNQIRPGTLAAIREIIPAPKIVCFTEDDMYARHNRSWFFSRGLRHYDVVFTTKSYNCLPGELPRLGARRTVFVDKGYDVHAHRPLTPDVATVDVGFVGSYEEARAKSPVYLARSGVAVNVSGSVEWRRLLGQHPGLTIEHRFLAGDEYARKLCSTRVNLCFLRKANRDRQTDRTMEIPACGAFMLAERTDEHMRLFAEGVEAAYFGTDDELVQKVRYYLDHEEEWKSIAAAGRQRCLKDGYSHHERLRGMLATIMRVVT